MNLAQRDVTVTGLEYSQQYNFYVVAQSSAGNSDTVTININPSSGSVSIQGTGTPAPLTDGTAGSSGGSSAPSQGPPSSSYSSSQPAPADSAVQGINNDASCRSDAEPAAPKSFTATPDGAGRIRLDWQNGDTSVCTDSFKLDGYVLKTGDAVISTQTGTTSYTLTQLQPGTEYAFTIAAVNSKGLGTPATAMASTPKSRRRYR